MVENIPQGVCFFDGQQRLIFANRRYAEIYCLPPEQIRIGMTYAELLGLRRANGTAPRSLDELRFIFGAPNPAGERRIGNVELTDGRRIHVLHRSTPNGGVAVTHEDVSEDPANRQLATETLTLQALIDFAPDWLFIIDREGRYLVANQSIALDFGFSSSAQMLGLTVFDLRDPEMAARHHALETHLMETGQSLVDADQSVVDRTGANRWMSVRKVPLRNAADEVTGLLCIGIDVTERRLADALRDAQSKILEMIAVGAPLDDVLGELVLMLELQLPGTHGSILLLDEEGLHLRHGAAPSLPKTYVATIDGLPLNAKLGPFGAAISRREPVVAKDLQADPLWEDFRGLTAPYGYASCWARPIKSLHGDPTGAFAIYAFAAREPTAAEIRVIEIADRIAGIAIDRRQADERIRYLATHDSLTALPNRTLLEDRLSQTMLYARRHGREAAVLFVDLDHFKFVNDSLGHAAGDELLKTSRRSHARDGASDRHRDAARRR